MYVGEEDRVSRSVALEKTYVHDVYNQMSAFQYIEQKNAQPWPKIKKFINDLEPGSAVCDVGCGSGKYLEINSGVYKVGIDICKKLTQMAKDDDKEVLLCDNLTLPFRDEAFDAVLSVAVIHHFATRERRICALKELARILRVGGRLLITVWAMEQKHLKVRNFETQDILVPWHRPQFQCSSLDISTSPYGTSEEDATASHIHLQVQPSDIESLYARKSGSLKSEEKRKPRLQLFRSLKSMSTSPSNSTLSSPNETCYSFVRKALQKLSRSSKREKSPSGTWYLESTLSLNRDDQISSGGRYEPDGCEKDEDEYDDDIRDLPIEIIRMDNMELDMSKSNETISLSQDLLQVYLPTMKSRSMSDIVRVETGSILRSRSSINTISTNNSGGGGSLSTKSSNGSAEKLSAMSDSLKPKLVKQKKSLCEDDGVEEITTTNNLTDDIQGVEQGDLTPEKSEKFKGLKQKSLTEEYMSRDRLREKEQVMQNIQKQTSLNEELMYRRQRSSLSSIKDTIFSATTAKRFQLFRSGLSNTIKNSTTNIEKVTGGSIKSGFVKIFQNLTGSENRTNSQQQEEGDSSNYGVRKSSSEDRGDEFGVGERRWSHEENSDSSKDNSLQSDASVDSEDSVISVIERKPANATTTATELCSPTKVMSPIQSSKILQHTLSGVLSNPTSPKIIQTLQGKSLSLPTSPRNITVSPSTKQSFKIPPVAQSPNEKILKTKISTNGNTFIYEKPSPVAYEYPLKCPPVFEDEIPLVKLASMQNVSRKMKGLSDVDMENLSKKLTDLSEKEAFIEREVRGDVCEGDENSKIETEREHTPIFEEQQIPANQKTEHTSRSVFAIIKNSSASSGGKSSAHTAQLDSYELFNPETEDVDTDSSGISTPDSVGSVISVKLEDFETPTTGTAEENLDQLEKSSTENKTLLTTSGSTGSEDLLKQKSSTNKISDSSKKSCHHAEEKGEAVKKIKVKVHSPKPDSEISPIDEQWGNECRQYLVEFAENLSEKLLAEIDYYKERNVNLEMEDVSPTIEDICDPYLTKLSEELHHVSRLSKELSLDYSGGSKNQHRDKKQPPPSDTEGEKNLELLTVSESSTDVESPTAGWLDSRRNTIESKVKQIKERESSDGVESVATTESSEKAATEVLKVPTKITGEYEIEPIRRKSCTIILPEPIRKHSKGDLNNGLQTRSSVESTDTVETVSSKTGTNSRMSLESDAGDTFDISKSKPESRRKSSSSHISLHPEESVESSDTTYDTSERTSDFSRQNTESRSMITQSSASLTSWSDCSKDIRFADRRVARCDGRSSSEETSSAHYGGGMLTRQRTMLQESMEAKPGGSADEMMSESTSQDSLTSGSGGSLTFHRYYHVFKEGELDQLIDEYVENLHIISSYYDHSNWCVVAEKVQVWTI